MLILENLKEELNFFAKQVIADAKKNLKDDTGALSKSLDYNIEVHKQSFTLQFLMNQYGMFQDKGVKGVGGVRKTTSKYKRSNNKGKLWKQAIKGGEFLYSFKEGKKPSAKHFKEWAERKGLNAYAVREAVYHQGIRPSLFFTKPFEQHFKTLSQDLLKAFQLDVEGFIKHTTKEVFKK